MTIKNILSRIEYTVIINGVEKPGNILYSTWNTNMLRQSEKVSGYKPETMFDPVARDNYQKYITIAYYAGLIPAKVIETRTNEVVDGCYTFTVETMGNLDPENDNTDNQPEEAQHGEIMEAVKEPTEPTDTKEKKVMKLDKDEFLKTELGKKVLETIEALDFYKTDLTNCIRVQCDTTMCRLELKEIYQEWLFLRQEIRDLFGVNYLYARNSKYYGLCTKDGSDWLFKVNREIDGKGE